MNKWIFISLIASAVILEVIADVFFKKWAIGGKTWIIVVGMLIYMTGTAIWAFSLKHEDLSKAIVIFTIANLVAAVIAGMIFFDERLTVTQWIGIALGLGSVFLLEI